MNFIKIKSYSSKDTRMWKAAICICVCSFICINVDACVYICIYIYIKSTNLKKKTLILKIGKIDG